MPVYVSGAHVTIGNVVKKERKKRAIVPKHHFHVSDIGRTPYCFRTFLVTLIGFIIVCAGALLTIIGYKPGILLPWYSSLNGTIDDNTTEPAVVANVLGEPGDLRVLVYCGPVLMGIGVFTMMVAIVLFCEIKDRYFNNILPKMLPSHSRKDKMYDKVIEEFRKNYFRGIEVPLRPHRKRSKCRFSFSLSPSGSLASLGRRLSHDFQKKLRRASHVSKTEKITTKAQRSSLKKFVKEDTWMKTSSLPNIRPKNSLKAFENEDASDDNIPVMPFISPLSAFEKVEIVKSPSFLDNPAYNDSPPEVLCTKPKLTKHASLDNPKHRHVTTVLVHQTSNNDAISTSLSSKNTLSADVLNSEQDLSSTSSSDPELGIKDIILSPLYNEQQGTSCFIPIQNYSGSMAFTPQTDRNANCCNCGVETFCAEHSSLGMESFDSSLSLSWDNIPSDWNDARRYTEPVIVYRQSFNNISNAAILEKDSPCNIAINEESKQCLSGSGPFNHCALASVQRTAKHKYKGKHTKTSKPNHVSFKSDSNLLHVGTYSLLNNAKLDTVSLDSLNLTEDILKNFDMPDSTYI